MSMMSLFICLIFSNLTSSQSAYKYKKKIVNVGINFVEIQSNFFQKLAIHVIVMTYIASNVKHNKGKI